ncbi:MAG: glycosyltransferase family 4 protein [Chloroflexi bacterium]|nr:glycosyltransferase family 4 protein [Chloroflexota bacterium]MCL5075619.1 glycosyltransferase family 4 protein [Chloroflexota bacterium]
MQELSYHLTTEIGKVRQSKVIAWGGSQLFLPPFLIYALARSIPPLLNRRITLLHLGDVILAPLGLILKRMFRVPVVANVHGLDLVYPHPLYQTLMPYFLTRLDKLVCISHHTKNECLKRGIPDEQCVVIPVGVDINEFAMSKETARRTVERIIRRPLKGVKVLLTVGRLVKRKGISHFVTHILPGIVARRMDVIYLIAGEGPEQAQIIKEIDTHNLHSHVFLLGKVDECTLPALYAAADLFVMPNISIAGDTEGFGIVALEACAAGLGVVASRLEGIQEVIEPGKNGLLLDPTDIAGYVDTILNLLADDAGCQHLGLKARAYVERRFNWPGIAEQYLQVFDEIRNKNNGR